MPLGSSLTRRSLLGAALLPLLAACGGDDDVPTPTAGVMAAQTPVAPTRAAATPATSVGTPTAGTPAASPASSPSPQASPAAGPTGPAGDILRRAAARLAEIQSVHFRLRVAGTTYIDDAETIRIRGAEGNVVRPDRVQARFDAGIAGQNLTLRIITVGETTWQTDIVTGKWVVAPDEIGYDPTTLFDPNVGLGPVMLGVTDARLVGEEEIDGRSADHVAASATQALIGEVTAETMGGDPVAVEVWVDRETGDLLRAVLVEPPNPSTTDPATWTLDLSDHDKEMTIEPPI